MTKDDLYDLHRDEIRNFFYKEDIPPDQHICTICYLLSKKELVLLHNIAILVYFLLL